LLQEQSNFTSRSPKLSRG